MAIIVRFSICACLLLLSAITMHAQCFSIGVTPGTQLTYNICNGMFDYVLGGIQYIMPINGAGVFTTTATATSPCSTTLSPASGSFTGIDPVLGTVVTTFDASRTATASTIVSNSIGSEFPATEDVYFYANCTMSSNPGITYRSIQEVHLQSTNVNSYNPHSCEQFTLVQAVDFEDPASPGIVAFTLQSATVQIN